MANSPGSERTACQDGMVVKARNYSCVASALPHSEGIAYKPPCGEVAMCRRVERMGPAKRGRTGTAEPGPERGPLGGGRPALQGGASAGQRPGSVRDNRFDAEVHEGRRQTGRQQVYAGSRLKPLMSGKAPPDRPAFQPYWGKPAVRNERGDRGNVGIMRSPVRASILPDCGGRSAMSVPTAILSLKETSVCIVDGARSSAR